MSLERCPFCNHAAENYYDEHEKFGVRCSKCTAKISGFLSKAAATKAWNRCRKTRRPADLPEYAVVASYSFDQDATVHLFTDYNQARSFLKTSWKEEIRVDTKENRWLTDYEISEAGDYAKIINHFDDRDDVTEWKLCNVCIS